MRNAPESTRPKILITESLDYSPRALEVYQSIGAVELGLRADTDLTGIAILVIRLAHQMNSDYLNSFTSLRYIVSPTTGLDHIDIDYCQGRGIQILSLNECADEIERISSTSELTIGLMLSLLRAIPKANEDVILHHKWNRDRFRSRQLSRLSLGIIGLGRIGTHVAKYACAFGMKVYSYDPYQESHHFKKNNVIRCSLEELMETVDIVTIHAKLRSDNKSLVSKENLTRLKPEALIVNTARGALLDEHAAATMLRENRLGGIAVDVLADETTLNGWQSSPLIEAAKDGYNVIITPHIGGCTIDAMHITEEMMAERMLAIICQESSSIVNAQ